ncbi:MAG: ATP-binding cassette domain-containing protein, partial [Eubacterium sp.]|nr:ATP-binding cassette domain-containing protein [Eubacterium sp.]
MENENENKNDNIIISTKNLTKIYRSGEALDFAALDNVSIDIKRSELTIIKGRSGSGKTTLLNMLGALDQPTSGSIMMNGVNYSDLNRNEMEEFTQLQDDHGKEHLQVNPAIHQREPRQAL